MANSVELITALLSTFEDPVGTSRPLWRDYSSYQIKPNFDVAHANGVLGMAARAGISYGYVDSFFENNWNEAGRVGMYRTSYHVLYPSQPAIKQADSWYKVHPNIEVIPRVIDLELSTGQTPQKIADVTWQMSEIVYERDGVRPIIYARYMLIQDWLKYWTSAMLAAHYYWLAQYRTLRYIEHAGPPTLPKWTDGTNMISRAQVVLHQTADKKAPFTGELPVVGASKSVDWDRWELGNEAEMHQWIKAAWGEGIEPPPPPPPGVQKQVKVTATALNIREESNATSKDIGTLVGGSDVPVYETNGVWYRIGGWIHGDYTRDI